MLHIAPGAAPPPALNTFEGLIYHALNADENTEPPQVNLCLTEFIQGLQALTKKTSFSEGFNRPEADDDVYPISICYNQMNTAEAISQVRPYVLRNLGEPKIAGDYYAAQAIQVALLGQRGGSGHLRVPTEFESELMTSLGITSSYTDKVAFFSAYNQKLCDLVIVIRDQLGFTDRTDMFKKLCELMLSIVETRSNNCLPESFAAHLVFLSMISNVPFVKKYKDGIIQYLGTLETTATILIKMALDGGSDMTSYFRRAARDMLQSPDMRIMRYTSCTPSADSPISCLVNHIANAKMIEEIAPRKFHSDSVTSAGLPAKSLSLSFSGGVVFDKDPVVTPETSDMIIPSLMGTSVTPKELASSEALRTFSHFFYGDDHMGESVKLNQVMVNAALSDKKPLRNGGYVIVPMAEGAEDLIEGSAYQVPLFDEQHPASWLFKIKLDEHRGAYWTCIAPWLPSTVTLDMINRNIADASEIMKKPCASFLRVSTQPPEGCEEFIAPAAEEGRQDAIDVLLDAINDLLGTGCIYYFVKVDDFNPEAVDNLINLAEEREFQGTGIVEFFRGLRGHIEVITQQEFTSNFGPDLADEQGAYLANPDGSYWVCTRTVENLHVINVEAQKLVRAMALPDDVDIATIVAENRYISVPLKPDGIHEVDYYLTFASWTDFYGNIVDRLERCSAEPDIHAEDATLLSDMIPDSSCFVRDYLREAVLHPGEVIFTKQGDFSLASLWTATTCTLARAPQRFSADITQSEAGSERICDDAGLDRSSQPFLRAIDTTCCSDVDRLLIRPSWPSRPTRQPPFQLL